MTGQVRLTSGSQLLWFVLCWDWLMLSGRGFRELSGSEVTSESSLVGRARSVAPVRCICLPVTGESQVSHVLIVVFKLYFIFKNLRSGHVFIPEALTVKGHILFTSW